MGSKKQTRKVIQQFERSAKRKLGENVARGISTDKKTLSVVQGAQKRKDGLTSKEKKTGKKESTGAPRVETLIHRRNLAIKKRGRDKNAPAKPQGDETVKPQKLAFDAETGTAKGTKARESKGLGKMSIDEFLAGGYENMPSDDEDLSSEDDDLQGGQGEESEDEEQEDGKQNGGKLHTLNGKHNKNATDDQDDEDEEEEDEDNDSDEDSDEDSDDDSDDDSESSSDEQVKPSKAKSKGTRVDQDNSDDEEEAHKRELEELKKKDPEFYKHLEQEGKELLRFGQEDGDDDEEEEEDDEQEEEENEQENQKDSKAGKKNPQNGTTKGAAPVFTAAMFRDLEMRVKEGKNESALKEFVYIFKIACRSSRKPDDVDEEESEKSDRYSFNSESLREKVIRSVVSNLCQVLDKNLDVVRPKGIEGKIKPPSSSKKWKKLEPVIKRFLLDFLRALDESKDVGTRAFLLRAFKGYALYLCCFSGKLPRAYIKQLVSIWGAPQGTDESIRLSSFVGLRQMNEQGGKVVLEQTLRSCYLEFVRGCKGNGIADQERIAFQARSLVELYGSNLSLTYELAFVYIRQLALHLRAAIISKTLESLKGVYSWQFLHCMRLWGSVLCAYPGSPISDEKKTGVTADEQQLRSLVYPFCQVALGAIRLCPSVRYLPLRLHLVRVLNSLARASQYAVPVSHVLLDTFRDQTFHERKPPKENADMTKPPELEHAIKLSKAALCNAQVQTSLIAGTCELLEQSMVCMRFSIAFPEVAFPVTVALRAFAKKTRVTQWRANCRDLVTKIEKWAAEVRAKRSKVSFGPSNVPRLHAFLSREEEEFRRKQDKEFVKSLSVDKDMVDLDDRSDLSSEDEDDEEDEESGTEISEESEAPPSKKRTSKVENDESEDDQSDSEEESAPIKKKAKLVAKVAPKKKATHAVEEPEDESEGDDVVEDFSMSDDE